MFYGMLKPQDIVVLLKFFGYLPGKRPPYAVIAKELEMSPSEVHGAMKRLQNSGLINRIEDQDRPNLSNALEFILHGLKYSFPAERGGISRGMPTSYAAEPLNKLINPGGGPLPVWPDPKGELRGQVLAPLYKSVPKAARKDPLLYRRLALIDAIRDGRARERALASEELKRSLRASYG